MVNAFQGHKALTQNRGKPAWLTLAEAVAAPSCCLWNGEVGAAAVSSTQEVLENLGRLDG